MAEERHVDLRDRDRQAMPENCPSCGEPWARVFDITGRHHVNGPADRKFAREHYGIDGDGWVAWIGLNAECPNGHTWLRATAAATGEEAQSDG